MRVGYKILSPGDEVTTINVGYDGNVYDNNFGDDNILNQEYNKVKCCCIVYFPYVALLLASEQFFSVGRPR